MRSTEANSATTATNYGRSRLVRGESEQESSDTPNETDTDAIEEGHSIKTKPANSLPNTAADRSETKEANAKPIAGQSATVPSPGTNVSEALPDNEATESYAGERRDGTSDVPAATLARHDTSTTIDTELVDATKHQAASDTTTSASNASVSFAREREYSRRRAIARSRVDGQSK